MAGRSFTHDMNRCAVRHDRELFGEGDEIDGSSVNFEPCRSAVGSPALLAGGLVGNGDGSGKQLLDTHRR